MVLWINSLQFRKSDTITGALAIVELGLTGVRYADEHVVK